MQPSGVALATVALSLCFAGELIERHLFFVAQVAPKKAKDIASFLGVIDRFAEVGAVEGPSRLLVTVLEDTGYVRELRAEDTVESQSRIENLQELIGVAREFEEREGPDLSGFLSNVSLVSDLDAMREGESAVTLMIDGGWTVGAPHSGIDFGAPDSST